MQINLKTQLHQIRAQIDREFIEKDNNDCEYGFFNLWWLETILKQAGYSSHRDKIRFLEGLNEKNKLLRFYELIGNPIVARIPAVSTWTEYKKSLNPEFDWNKMNHGLFLTDFTKDCALLFPQNNQSIPGFKPILGINLSVDGKDLRQTRNGTSSNVKTIQAVTQNRLLFSEQTPHEMSWIHGERRGALKQLLQRFRGVQFCLTGDAIYNTFHTRKIFRELGMNFLLPLKNRKGSRLKSRVLQQSRLAEAKGLAFQETFVRFLKQEKIVDRVVLTPLPRPTIPYAMRIHRTSSSTGPGEFRVYEDEILLLGYTLQPCSPELLRELYAMKLSHWQVETYHQKKDVLLHEDRDHKSVAGAQAAASQNNFILHLLRQLYGGNSRRFLQRFHLDLLAEFLQDSWVLFLGLIFTAFQSPERG